MKIFLLILMTLLGCSEASAAARFWNPYSVTNAVSGTAGVCRLTISPAITGGGLVAGSTVIVTGITGVTGCNVTATISTVVDSTHIELTGTTFGGAGFGGTACAAGGVWSSTNTSNWHTASSSTCGLGGSSVPGSSDTVTLDANSKGGTIVPNYDFTLSTLTAGAFTGTLDFSINNNSPSMVFFNGAGAGVRTFKMGSGTWTITSSSQNIWDMSVSTNLTFNANTSTLFFSSAATNSTKLFANANGLTYFNLKLGGNAGGGAFNFDANMTISGTFTVLGPNVVLIGGGTTITLSGAPVWNGTSSTPILFSASPYDSAGNPGASNMVLGAVSTASWAGFRNISFSSHTLTVSNSFGTGGGGGITYASSGGSCILGGWLLWRDLPDYINDNFPAWLDKAS